MTYVPPHVHTSSGSVGDSILQIKDLIKKAKSLNMPAMCITNHGSLADMYDFYFECVSNNIKPIIGCEVYTTDDRLYKEKDSSYNHLILLAKNNIGLKNLLSITANAQLEGFYYRPRTDFEFLKQHDTTGLIATTACVASKVNQFILDDKIEEAKILLIELNDIFDDFYLEIQPGNFEDQIKINNQLIQFSMDLEIPLIASNDIHYLNKEDYNAHDAHVKVYRKQKKIDDSLIYPDKCYYLMSEEELVNELSKTMHREIAQIAVDNSKELADICNIKIDIDGLNLPEFNCPRNMTPKAYLEYVCLKKIEEIKTKIINPSKYIDRLYFELEVIEKLGFTSYFLIVRDFLEYANEENIMYGPGRGSVCGSLTAYLAGLTKVDPIKYDLLFDRFLSVHRTGSIPDVDLDFESNKRFMMFDYVVNKYGADHCAAVSTFQIRKAKSAIKDACRIFDIEEADAIAKLIPETVYDEEGDKMTDLSITESLKVVEELREYQEIYPDMFDMAIKLEGLPRATSIHAAGTLIAKTPLHDLVPMIRKADSNLNATSFDLSQAEKMMLVKYDFLGLSTLTVIDSVQKATGDYFDIEFDKYNNKDVWNMIGSRSTTGLFQIASNTYKQRMPRLKPKTIEELAACLALVRGPCISAGTDKLYMDINEGKAERKLIHPVYDNAVKETNGVMIYQEQLMECCKNFGLPLHEGYNLMKASAKKKMDKIESYKADLKKLSLELNMSDEQFEEIFQMIIDSGLYSFNKSHAVAYAILCYMTAYYKHKYPLEFMAAELTNIYNSVAADKRKDRVSETVKECRRLGIKFLPADINKSSWEFKVEEGCIRIGTCSISSYGEKASKVVSEILPVKDLNDFYERVNKTVCSKRATVPLLLSGAFGDRIDSYKQYCDLREEEPSELITIHKNLKISLYDDDKDIEEGLLGFNYIHSLTNDFEPIGYKHLNKRALFETKAIITRVKKKRDKNKNMMAFLTIETGDGSLDAVVFADTYDKNKSLFKKDLLINIKARKDNEDSCIIVGVS